VRPPSAPLSQLVGSLPCLTAIEARRLAGQLLGLELLGAAIPVGDLLGQPLIDGGPRPIDPLLCSRTDLVEVERGDVFDRIVDGPLLKVE
jgi:hypothetical protein